MPTYEFRCPSGHTFDQFHRISDVPSTAPCPTCGAESVRAISGGAGLVFKGSGFYLTDYGKNAHRTSGPAQKSEGGSSGGSDGGSSGGATGDSGGGSGGSSGGAGGSTGGSSSGGSGSGSTSGGSSSGGASGGSSSSTGGSTKSSE